MNNNDKQVGGSRKSIRLKNYDYSASGIYFITICCYRKISRFGKIEDGKMIANELGKAALRQWDGLHERFQCFENDIIQIMPNHIHAIFILKKLPVEQIKTIAVADIIRTYKSLVFQNCLTLFKQRRINMGKLWQRNYFEQVIRSEETYVNVKSYIIDNPRNWDTDKLNINNHLYTAPIN